MAGATIDVHAFAGLRRFALGVAAFSIAVSLTVLVGGWVLDVAPLRSLVPGTVSMKASTATMFVLSSVSLIAWLKRDRGPIASAVAPRLRSRDPVDRPALPRGVRVRP